MRSTWDTAKALVTKAAAPMVKAMSRREPPRARDSWSNLTERNRAINEAADPRRTWIPRRTGWLYGGKGRRDDE